MQEDMRMSLPAREPEPEPKGVEIQLIQYRDGTPEQEERSTIVMRPKPGDVVKLYTQDWAPPTPPGVHIAREDWKRMVSRTATGVTIGAKPGHGDDGPEIYIDLPETVAAWLAVRILDALAKPHTVNEIVASEGYCPSGMTLEAARRTIAEAYAKPRGLSAVINEIVDDRRARQANVVHQPIAPPSGNGPFLMRGLCHHLPREESFDTLDEALDEFARVRYRSHINGITEWWPDEIVRPDGTIIDDDELERLRPDD